MNTRGEPEPIGAILRDFFQTSGIAARLKYLELYTVWEQMVGPEVRAHARVAGVVHHKVYVEVDSATHLHELHTFHRQALLGELRRRLPALHIADLVFRPGRAARS